MKAALVSTFVLCLFATAVSADMYPCTYPTDPTSTASLYSDTGCSEEPPPPPPAPTEYDEFQAYSTETYRMAYDSARPCNSAEFNQASQHCDTNHAGWFTACRMTGCLVRNGWIVYSWSGYVLDLGGAE